MFATGRVVLWVGSAAAKDASWRPAGLSARILYLLTILHIVWVVLYLHSLVSSVHDYGLKDSWSVGG